VVGGSEINTFGISIVAYLYVLVAVLFALFINRGHALKERNDPPLLDSDLLKNLPFTLGMSIGALFFLVNAAMLFAVSVFMQAGVKLDPLQTALATLPFSLILAVVSFGTPGLGKRVAPKWIVMCGSVVMAMGLWLIAADLSMSMEPMDVLPGMLLAGLGAGLMMAQGTSVTMMNVPAEQSGAASGLSETMKEIIGQGFAVALAGAVLFGTVYGSMADSFAETENIRMTETEQEALIVELEDTFQTISEEEEQAFIAELPEKTRNAYSEIVNRAAESGVRAAIFVTQLVLGLCFLLAFLLPPRKLEE